MTQAASGGLQANTVDSSCSIRSAGWFAPFWCRTRVRAAWISVVVFSRDRQDKIRRQLVAAHVASEQFRFLPRRDPLFNIEQFSGTAMVRINSSNRQVWQCLLSMAGTDKHSRLSPESGAAKDS